MTRDLSNLLPPGLKIPSHQLSRRSLLRNAGLVLALQAAGCRGRNLFAKSLFTPGAEAPGCLFHSRTSYPPQLAEIISKLDPALDIFPTELYVAQIEKILAAWSAALCKSDVEPGVLGANVAEQLSATSFHPVQIMALRATGPLLVEKRTFPDAQATSRAEFVSQLTGYLSPFAKLETVELEIFGIRVVSESPLTVDTDLRMDLVGTDKNAQREQRVGSLSLTWTRGENTHWNVTRWTAHEEVRSRLAGPGFADITAHCLPVNSPGVAQLTTGIDEWRTRLDAAIGIDVYGNHGIAAGDIDGKGFDSIYVCQPSGLPNRLYRNKGDGTFEDITEASGTGILDGTASAIFADFQNRGVQDLVVVRTGGPLLFENQGNGKFHPRLDAFHFQKDPQGTFTSAAVADYDRDGRLDIYFCVYAYYQGLNQYQFPSPYYDAQNGPPNFLFRNRGDGTFEDVTVASNLMQNNNRFSFAAAWCDYDDSGFPSLYVANDFGRKNLYRNRGDGTFEDVANAIGVEDYGPGMSTCWLDYDNDGKLDVYVANMWLKEGKRITANDNFLPDAPAAVRALYQKHNAGNSLYRNAGHNSFENKSVAAGTAMGRWSWSCGSWDFDNDGYADLYVANGFVSGPNPRDLQSFFWRQVAQRSFASAGASPEYEMAWNAVNELVRSDFSWSGYQRNVFYANNHDKTFADVSGVLGLDCRDDSRAFALADFDHDGRLEIALKNRTGPQLRILRNDLDTPGNSVAFRLTGKNCNRDAIGAAMTLEAGGVRQTKFISAGSGFASQHTKELFFGIGSSKTVDSVSIRWPSGAVKVFRHISANHRFEIEEGRADYKAAPYGSSRFSKSPAPLPASTASGGSPTWLVAPLHPPLLALPDLQGKIFNLAALKDRRVLLCFVQIGCEESKKQLEQLENSLTAFSAAGFVVLAVFLNPPSSHEETESFSQSAGLTFPILFADEQTAGAWNIQFRFLFDRRRDMPIPVSYLLDKGGAIVALYQGFAAPAVLLADANSIPATPEQMQGKAMPYPGPYYGNPMARNDFTLGIAFVEYGFLDDGQAAFQRAVDADPNAAAAWFNLGTVYLRKKNYLEARRCLKETIRLNPKDADAWNNLGMISGEEQKYDEALEEFHLAARANPNFLVAVENMMRIYQFQGRAADAQKAFEELIASAPDNSDLHLALAMTFVAQKEDELARKELETAVRLRPGNVEALNNLGVVLLRLGRAQEALDRFEQCEKIAPDFDRPFINAALIYNSAGHPEKARDVLNGFLARHPDNSEARKALEKMGAR